MFKIKPLYQKRFKVTSNGVLLITSKYFWLDSDPNYNTFNLRLGDPAQHIALDIQDGVWGKYVYFSLTCRLNFIRKRFHRSFAIGHFTFEIFGKS